MKNTSIHTCQQFPDSPAWTASQKNNQITFGTMHEVVRARYGLTNVEPLFKLIRLYRQATATLAR